MYIFLHPQLAWRGIIISQSVWWEDWIAVFKARVKVQSLVCAIISRQEYSQRQCVRKQFRCIVIYCLNLYPYTEWIYSHTQKRLFVPSWKTQCSGCWCLWHVCSAARCLTFEWLLHSLDVAPLLLDTKWSLYPFLCIYYFYLCILTFIYVLLYPLYWS